MYNIENILLFDKMAKEMNVSCNFLTNQLTCELPEYTMDVVLKVRMRMGEHTFREDVYMRTLKYRRWNNELRPFRSLKRRVANIFWKQNSLSDDSKRTSTQTTVNNVESEEDESVPTNSKRKSIHSNWSDLLSVEEEAEYKRTYRGKPNIIGVATTSTASSVKPTNKEPSISPVKRTVKNIVLVLYTPKPKDWGSWCIRSPYATSTIASPPMVRSNEPRKEEEGKMVYELYSPYYSPVHPPEFYEDE